MGAGAFLRRYAAGRALIEALAGGLADMPKSGFRYGRFARYRRWFETVHDASMRPAPACGPRLSVLVPAFNADPDHFEAMLASLVVQSYTNFEAVVCDDGSTQREALGRVEALRDDRFSLVHHAQNSGIAAATNTAMAASSGDLIAFVDQDDVLAPDALARLVDAFADNPTAVYAYSDEDKMDARGRRSEPYLKPRFDRALLYRRNYLNHLSAIRSEALRGLGGLDSRFDGAQDYDLSLRVLEACGPAGFAHVPRILYHWRTGAWAKGVSRLGAETAAQARGRALEAHLARIENPAPVRVGSELEPMWSVPPDTRVSVIIPMRDRLALTQHCLQDARAGTGGLQCDWVLVDNGSEEPETLDWLETQASRADTTVVRAPGRFNFSALINQGAAASHGALLLILNNDVLGGAPGWIETLAAEALRPWAGPVGVKLVYPDGRLQHGGVALGLGGVAGHVMKGSKPGEAGPFGHLALTRTVSAVTGACLMVRRDVFEEVGGLDVTRFAVALNDVDFCLRAAEAGYDCVWTPKVTLTHVEGASRGRETGIEPRLKEETARFRNRWALPEPCDPYLNPNLSHKTEQLGLAWPDARR